MASITLKNVSKSFETIEVIKDINLSIKNGEFVVLVGPSGCGKSTLLRIISGLEYPDKGKIIIDNLDHTHKIPSERKLSMFFQSYALYPHMNVFDNIGFSLKTKGIDKSILVKKVNKVSKILKLNHLLNRLPKELSGGQRQQVAVSRALMTQPKVLMLDEPTAGVSPIVMDEIFDRIIQIKETGVAVVIVEQNAKQALKVADFGHVLVNGENRFYGKGNELLSDPEVRKSFLGG